MLTTPEQLSVAEIADRLTAGTSEAQDTVTFKEPAGVEITGAILSFTVITCTKSLWLPQTSVARYVLLIENLLAQEPGVVTSPTWLMLTTPEQLSVAKIADRLTAGTSEAQDTVTFNEPAGVEITGAILSLTVIT